MSVHVTSNVELRNYVRLLLNVELRNYVIHYHVRLLFKYCDVIGLLLSIPIRICITVIPPSLPSPQLHGNINIKSDKTKVKQFSNIGLGGILGKVTVRKLRTV